MKNALIIISFFALVSSCSKDSQLQNFKNQVAGNWEIEARLCGQCPNSVTNYPVGNGAIIVFFNDGVFERRIQDSVIFKGKFFLTKAEECGKPNSDIALSTNESVNMIPLFVRIVSGKLQIGTPYCYADGATTIYRRIQ